MIAFSKPYRYIGSIFLRSRQLNGHCKRNYSTHIREYDRENYLNKKKARAFGFFEYFTLVVPATCFALAVWQVNRKIWKDQLVRDLEERTKLPAIELPEDLTERLKLEYRTVKVRGTFDHSREMYIGPRSKIINNKFAESEPFLWPSFGTMPNKPNIGLVVVTPFKLADRDVEILVNRGWIPMDQQDISTRLDGQVEGEVELEGIVRLKEKKPTTPGIKNLSRGRFTYRDIESMAELAGTSHFYIDATFNSTVPGGPLGGQTQIHLKNTHLEYILTWSSIGFYTLYMWHKRWIRKLH